MTPTPPPAKETTAQALVRAATMIFGQKGFEAASTREIAAAAKTNVASIAYHFGGKEGLRAACAEHFAQTVGALLANAARIEPTTPQEAAALLGQIVESLSQQLIGNAALRPMVAFVQREMTAEGPGVDMLYNALALPAHARLCQLWALATGGDAESDEVKLVVFSLIGQLIYFRIGAPLVTRRMGWPAIGPNEAQAIARILRRNVETILSSARGAK